MDMIDAVAVPTFRKGLTAGTWITTKIRAHYEASSRELNSIMHDRIAADMRPFSFQIAQVVTHSVGTLQRLAGEDGLIAQPPSEFRVACAMLREALAELDAFDPRSLHEAGTRKVVWSPVPSTKIEFAGAIPFLIDFAIPTFHFHLATAYAIARKNGVPVGKRDFLARGEEPPGVNMELT